MPSARISFTLNSNHKEATMRWIKVPLVATPLLFISTVGFASELIYLSCDLPSRENLPPVHFDFVLDEQNSTVSYFVKEANATNKDDAVFGSETITWTNNLSLGSITRTISRVDLEFVQDTDLAGIKMHEVGSCSLKKKPSSRKF
jgi:hypothetical protein